MNVHAILAIYLFELNRARRTALQSLAMPVVWTSMYFIVFGAAIGARISTVEGIGYGAFILPGLVLLSTVTESISHCTFGIYVPRFTGAIYEILSAPVSALEVVIGYVGASTTKSLLLSAIILTTARIFVGFTLAHPVWLAVLITLTSLTFSCIGFIIGIWADDWQKVQMVPALILTPLTFLGGIFYSISMLPAAWRHLVLLNPMTYLASAFRWSFYGLEDIGIIAGFVLTALVLIASLCGISWIFRTGYRLRT